MCSFGADFEEHGSAEPDRAESQGNGDGKMLIGKGHVDVATVEDGVQGHSADAEE